MDGKSISNVVSQIPVIKTTTKKEVKSQESYSDRDPDGRRSQKDSSRELSEEEKKKAIEMIKALPGFKKNNLQIRLEVLGKLTIVYVEDSTGKVIRRIKESELCHFLDNGPTQKGQIYNRSA